MVKNQLLRIGTRGSELALWQTNWVKDQLLKKFPTLRIDTIVIKTTGDKILDSPLSKIGNKGLFIKEIEHALLNNEIDLAVHSLKDVPTSIPEGLTIGAVTKREDVRDVFISHPKKKHTTFDELPHSARIATGSLRRKCQLLHWRPDIEIVDIRGNLSTRFRKLEESDWDGMILARAGVVRLGWEVKITEILPTERMLPAVGQGALAVEIRTDDRSIKKIVGVVHDETTAIATRGERALLRELEGGCQVPIGTHGRITYGQFLLDAIIGSVDGKKTVRGKIHGGPEHAEELGRALAQTLLESGAREILEKIRHQESVPTPAV
jgi:hydroxymethylbilane synthase